MKIGSNQIELKLKRGLFFLFASLLLFCGWLMLRITIPYFSFRYDIDFLLTKQSVLHISSWRWAFYIHISTSLVVLVAGLFQFSTYLQRKFMVLHRWLGKVYIFLILAMSAPSGLIMAFYANGGFFAKCSFVIISLLWWFFTLKAYLAIKKKRIREHITYMTRSYALTLSAISLRTYVVVLPYFIHLHGKEMYILVSWLSWIPNLIIAEILLRKKVISWK